LGENQIIVNAYAKLNLSIDVLGKRSDGYHQVSMLMQSISLHDEVSIYPSNGLTVECNNAAVPSGPDNLAYKAAELLKRETNYEGGARIVINKNIPVAAGLAGGSSDAAAVMLALNNLWGLRLTIGRLGHLAGRLGSDIPFCLLGGTCLATERGERLTLLPPAPHFWLVLAKPDFGVPTAQVYDNFDPQKVQKRPNNRVAVKAIEAGDRELLLQGMENVLESSTFRLYPQVEEIKELMYRYGVEKAMMCGSGPTVFGIARGKSHASEIVRRLQERNGIFVQVAETI